MRTIQLAALATVLGVTTVGCGKDDSGTGIATTGEGEGEGEGEGVGDITATGGVLIVEAGCEVIWDISGSQCSGCDLGWDASLALSDSTSCDFGDNTSGTLEVSGGALYFGGDYWAAATTGGNAISWATAGYVYGAGGGTYVYAGSGTY